MYEKILSKYNDIKIRKIPKQNIPLRDCIIFNFKSQSIAKFFLKEISKFKIATKNIPDALEWHFAKYWDHIFEEQGINKNQLLKSFPRSSLHLEKSIAIFIYAREELKKVRNKIKKIDVILGEMKKKKILT